MHLALSLLALSATTLAAPVHAPQNQGSTDPVRVSKLLTPISHPAKEERHVEARTLGLLTGLLSHALGGSSECKECEGEAGGSASASGGLGGLMSGGLGAKTAATVMKMVKE
ncbi:hypothetical protein CNMCM5623_001618 [Aspergillus felis]|uniref:Uncharacterized protein n=1 Tax=Aspergillus felis TaxID=1287682 RepID=A0A8H6Q9U3_9EURO|nr:hypothetical protein CNMCM5623_001618 [Aspergillus felis]KAF7184045.1 hypothetical protein CNMCM7691_004604 [Aspergillus felis]